MTYKSTIKKNRSNLPVLVLTGASGFIGRQILESFKHDFFIYAIARRPQRFVGIAFHKNVKWIRLDIRYEKAVAREFEEIAANGGADFVIHLAGYYDFTNKYHPDYQDTNINGTHFILKHSEKLGIKRFIFASSLTVTHFGKNGPLLNEKSPADADFYYAWSKREGEKLIREYSKKYPCTILRCAAIFNDWCEYGPLYALITTWLANRWDSHVLSGKGEAAIPYLHTKNLNSLIYRILQSSQYLPAYALYIASPDGCTSQRELHELAVRYSLGRRIKPIFFPNWIAFLGVTARFVAGRLRGKKPFIRPWMLKYTDKHMEVDASETRRLLGWKPVERFHIQRRLLFLIENMKSNPYEWHRRNKEALHQEPISRPNLLIYESMLKLEDTIITESYSEVIKEENNSRFEHYLNLEESQLTLRIRNLYEMLKKAVVLGDRLHMLAYARSLAVDRFKEDFEVQEVAGVITLVGNEIVRHLKADAKLKKLHQRIHDEILLTVQLIIDELEDSYERLSGFS